jgi:hypothetical protein
MAARTTDITVEIVIEIGTADEAAMETYMG